MSETKFNLSPSNMEVISEISPSKFDLLIKTIEKTNIEPICIEESQLVHKIDVRNYIHMDMISIFGEGVNMKFSLTKGTKKTLKLFRGNRNVIITRKGDKYLFTNSETEQVVPILANIEHDELPIIDYPKEMIEIENIDKLKKFSTQNKDLYLHIFDNEIGYISNGKGSRFYLCPSANSTYQDTTPDRVLGASSFLSICNDHVEIGIGEDEHDYWLVTKAYVTDEVIIISYEKLYRSNL